jgi:hypothetical protein
VAYLVASVVKVLQRSLFRAPVHEHYGTGIASGLVDRPGYAVGGRVNLQQGGDPVDDLTKQSEARKQLQNFVDDSFDTLSNGLQNAMVTEYLSNLDAIKGLDKSAQKEYFNNFVNEWYNTLPEDILDFIKEGAKKDGLPQAKQLYQEIQKTLKETFNEIGTYETKVYMDSVANNGQAMPNFQSQLQGFNNTYGGQIGGLSEIAGKDMTPGKTKEKTEIAEGDPEFSIVPPPRPEMQQTGLMGLDQTGEDFRKRYVDYLQQLQGETGIAEKRRRQAREAGFFNLGAADPVQPGESLVRAGIQAFRDPMAELRAQEAVQAEDIYKRGADILDQALAPSESANVLLIERLVAGGVPEAQALDIVTGLAQAKASQLERVLGDQQIMNQINQLMQGVDDGEGNVSPGMTFPEAVRSITGMDLLQGATDIVTQPTLTAGTIGQVQGMAGGKDGGRVKLQEGGEALTEAVAQEQMGPTAINAGSPSVSPMSFDELREKLPDYISDDVVKLLSENPMALMELAQAQTDRDLKEFEKKYQVDVTMPLAESEVDYTGAV